LMGFAVFEQLGGRLETVDKVIEVFDLFLQEEVSAEREFYMHTDQHAVNRVQSELGQPHQEFDILNIPPELQQKALDLLSNPGPTAAPFYVVAAICDWH